MSRVCVLLLLAIATAVGQDARQIVTESQNRSRSKSQQYEGTLEVFNAQNKTGAKRWTYQRIGSFGESKILVRFTAPAEIKGLALLILNHPDRASDQWLWTPAIERERKIALQDRSTRFFGTDFTFEDLEERDVEQFDFKLLGEQAIDGAACWKIESKPKPGRSSQYAASLLSIRKDNYVITQVENFNKGTLIRRIHSSDIEKVDGIATPRTVEVVDPARQSRTVMKLDKLRFNIPLKDDDFSLDSLRRN